MKFKSLEIHNWKQFDNIDIEFHDRLTVLTGANASGKTTLLNLLAQHFGWNFQELPTPMKDRDTGEIKFLIPVSHSSAFFVESQSDYLKIQEICYRIGEIIYTDGSQADIEILDETWPTLNILIPRTIRGVYIPSDRPEFTYKSVDEIPKGKNSEMAFSSVSTAHRNRSLNPSGLPARNYYTPPCYYIKETLLSWGVFGFGSEVIVSNRKYRHMYRGFKDVLKKILPEELGFESYEIREAEIVFVTKSGEFMMDAVSGGIGALIDMAWQIYTYSENVSDPFIVLIDEIETHLHATMQRRLLPSFLEAFPNVQFIVSTHSPLVVSSVRDSSVYVLKYNDENRVESMPLDITGKARDAVDILKDVLGVSFTMPIWVENKLDEINEKYSKLDINEDTFAALRKELTEIGLEDLVPLSIDKILSSK